MSKKRKAFKITILILNILALLGLGFSSVFFFLRYHNLQNSSLTPDQKIARYEKEIAKSFTLPKDERPTMAELSDATTLDTVKKADAIFFKSAASDDVLLIYKNAPLLVIYNPTTKKIINSGPYSFSTKIATQLIGTKADRDAVNGILKQAFATTLNVSAQNDAKVPLTTTFVVDVTGKNTQLATKLATELKGKVSVTTPDGQEAPASGVGIAIYAAPTAP